MMKRGFTLIELLITIIILSVLAAIAIPGFSKSKTKNNAAQAVTYMRAIRLAEKMHYAKTEVYVACLDSAAVTANLGVEINSSSYNFDVALTVVDLGGGLTKPGFTVTATDGTGDTLTLTQDNAWGGSSSYKPAA